MKFSRHQNNEKFVSKFQSILANLSECQLQELMSQGQFQALGHGCWDVRNHNIEQCDNCYSGDTECDMTHGSMLGQLWLKAAKELDLDIRPVQQTYDDDDAEEDSSSVHECNYCNRFPTFVDELCWVHIDRLTPEQITSSEVCVGCGRKKQKNSQAPFCYKCTNKGLAQFTPEIPAYSKSNLTMHEWLITVGYTCLTHSELNEIPEAIRDDPLKAHKWVTED